MLQGGQTESETGKKLMTMLGYAFVGHISDLGDEYSVEKMDQSSDIIKTLKEKDIEFKYLGIEDYDSKKCVHFELSKKDGSAISQQYYKEELYVDKSVGSGMTVMNLSDLNK